MHAKTEAAAAPATVHATITCSQPFKIRDFFATRARS
jgi:hypothetical protein